MSMKLADMSFGNVHPRDIHKGDILWESGQYGSIQFEVINDPTHVDGRWEWKARTWHGTEDYLITDGYEHYGPRIYRQPVYMHNQKPLDYKDEQNT